MPGFEAAAAAGGGGGGGGGAHLLAEGRAIHGVGARAVGGRTRRRGAGRGAVEGARQGVAKYPALAAAAAAAGGAVVGQDASAGDGPWRALGRHGPEDAGDVRVTQGAATAAACVVRVLRCGGGPCVKGLGCDGSDGGLHAWPEHGPQVGRRRPPVDARRQRRLWQGGQRHQRRRGRHGVRRPLERRRQACHHVADEPGRRVHLGRQDALQACERKRPHSRRRALGGAVCFPNAGEGCMYVLQVWRSPSPPKRCVCVGVRGCVWEARDLFPALAVSFLLPFALSARRLRCFRES